MTERQKNIETIRLAWELYFGADVPMPDEKHVGIWLHHSGGIDLILEVIEQAAKRHKANPLTFPPGWVWAQLKRRIEETLSKQDCG